MPENFHTLPEFRVRFSETDMSGAAHWSSILRWTENAESDFFRARGLDFATSENGVAKSFRRTNLQVEFLSPAHYDDRISVEIKLLSQDSLPSLGARGGTPSSCQEEGRGEDSDLSDDSVVSNKSGSGRGNWEFSIFVLDGDEKRLVARGSYTSVCTESAQ